MSAQLLVADGRAAPAALAARFAQVTAIYPDAAQPYAGQLAEVVGALSEEISSAREDRVAAPNPQATCMCRSTARRGSNAEITSFPVSVTRNIHSRARTPDAGLVGRRLDHEHHPGLEHRLVCRHEPRVLVHRDADRVARVVRVRGASSRDHGLAATRASKAARGEARPQLLARPLDAAPRAGDQTLERRARPIADDQRARAVAPVAADARREVDEHRIAVGEHAAPRPVEQRRPFARHRSCTRPRRSSARRPRAPSRSARRRTARARSGPPARDLRASSWPASATALARRRAAISSSVLSMRARASSLSIATVSQESASASDAGNEAASTASTPDTPSSRASARAAETYCREAPQRPLRAEALVRHHVFGVEPSAVRLVVREQEVTDAVGCDECRRGATGERARPGLVRHLVAARITHGVGAGDDRPAPARRARRTLRPAAAADRRSPTAPEPQVLAPGRAGTGPRARSAGARRRSPRPPARRRGRSPRARPSEAPMRSAAARRARRPPSSCAVCWCPSTTFGSVSTQVVAGGRRDAELAVRVLADLQPLEVRDVRETLERAERADPVRAEAVHVGLPRDDARVRVGLAPEPLVRAHRHRQPRRAARPGDRTGSCRTGCSTKSMSCSAIAASRRVGLGHRPASRSRRARRRGPGPSALAHRLDHREVGRRLDADLEIEGVVAGREPAAALVARARRPCRARGSRSSSPRAGAGRRRACTAAGRRRAPRCRRAPCRCRPTRSSPVPARNCQSPCSYSSVWIASRFHGSLPSTNGAIAWIAASTEATSAPLHASPQPDAAVVRLDPDDDVGDAVSRHLARDLAVQVGEADRSRLERRDAACPGSSARWRGCSIEAPVRAAARDRGGAGWLDGSTARPPSSRAGRRGWAARARRPSRARAPSVVLADIDEARAAQVADAIRAEGGRARRCRSTSRAARRSRR